MTGSWNVSTGLVHLSLFHFGARHRCPNSKTQQLAAAAVRTASCGNHVTRQLNQGMFGKELVGAGPRGGTAASAYGNNIQYGIPICGGLLRTGARGAIAICYMSPSVSMQSETAIRAR